jgi:adenosine deaminase
MTIDSFLRYLLDDDLSLDKYYRQHVPVTLADIKRSAFLKARERGYNVPDHYYRLGNDASFDGINELSQIFTVGLPKLTADCLEIREGRVVVKGTRINDWQLLLPNIPPLLLVSAYIWYRFGPCLNSVSEYASHYLQPSLRYTAMPSANIPEMDYMKSETGGFYDLHLHLNGTLETDLVWPDFLRYPDLVYEEVKQASETDSVKEQYSQMTGLSSPDDFRALFKIAGRLREWLFCTAFSCIAPDFKAKSLEGLLSEVAEMDTCFLKHPVKEMMGESAYPLILEGMLYVKVLDYLAENPLNYTAASAFHYYLLILGLCNKLLVQQTSAFGFQQFQKYSSNKLREYSERTYKSRFFQIAGNDLSNISHIEGRLSAKQSIEDYGAAIQKIREGFDNLVRSQTQSSVKPSSLSLVVHFIKKSCNQNNHGNRFKSLQADIDRKTNVLIDFLNERCSESQLVKGVDAAASEFDTPPEVFAPYFKHLRESGISHFTYHAGEDFFHVLSGLRAVYEAVTFLQFSTGDRIGHATACGIDISLWQRNVGGSILMNKETYLDDLTFAYNLIAERNDKDLGYLLPIIALRACEYASSIYPFKCDISDLIEAWKLRAESPQELLDSLLSKPRESRRVAENIIEFYHSEQGRQKGSQIISVRVDDVFSVEELAHLQHFMLEYLHEKQIVIETLPTSNVMIGHHRDYSTYHLYNWYLWAKQGIKVPAIVVGTDDPGIFATNIYNEYCHIYCQFVFEKKVSIQETMSFIRSLHHNAEIYKF